MLRGLLGRQPESGSQRGALNGGHLADAPAHGPEKLVQPGKRQARFRLDASGREHQHAPLPRGPRGVRQKPGLADTRFAPKHQRLAMNRDLIQQRPQDVPLLVATQQGRSFIASSGNHDLVILSPRNAQTARRRPAKPITLRIDVASTL